MKRHGFTLVETLLGLMFLTSLLSLVTSVLGIISNFEVDDVTQEDVFEVQFKQFLIRNPYNQCDSSGISSDTYEISLDNNRLVKRPGYEVLLQGVDYIYFNCDLKSLEVRFIDQNMRYFALP